MTSPCAFPQALRSEAELQDGNVGWLKARLAALSELCWEADTERHGDSLSKLSSDFKGLLTSLMEVSYLLMHMAIKQ